MPAQFGRTNGTKEAYVVSEHRGDVSDIHIVLSNPNTAQVTGKLYRKHAGNNYFVSNFSVDGGCPWEIRPPIQLAGDNVLLVTLDSAPTTELTFQSTWGYGGAL
jgi:hypothetical protein